MWRAASIDLVDVDPLGLLFSFLAINLAARAERAEPVRRVSRQSVKGVE
jgi:hypothetical protein